MNKTLLDYQDDWEKLVHKGINNFSLLTRSERIWFTVQALINTVDNGGLISHYYNSDANWNNETIEDLDFIGFSTVADLLKKINHLFPNGNVPNDIDKRNDIISNWPNNMYDDLLDKMDEEFYSYEKELENRLIKQIENYLTDQS